MHVDLPPTPPTPKQQNNKEPTLTGNKNTLADNREDYAAWLMEIGRTEEWVRSIVDDRSDHADLPPAFDKAIVSLSPLEGCGMFATKPLAAGEHIGPARIGHCRTVLGRMTNHAKHPNCIFVATQSGGLEMFTSRGVDAWEELTLDYRQAARTNPAAGVRPVNEGGT